MKRLTTYLLVLLITLSICLPAYADSGPTGIGKPYVDINGAGDSENIVSNALIIVPMLTATTIVSPPVGISTAIAAVILTDDNWKPNWLQIPYTRYWVDDSTKLVSTWGGIIPIPNLADMGPAIFNILTNILFSISKYIIRLAIELFIAAFHTKIWVVFGKTLAVAARKIWEGTGSSKGIKDTLFMLALSVAGFYYIYKLTKQRYHDILKGILATIVITAMMFVYLANTESILDCASDATDTISGAAFGALSFDSSEVPTNSIIDQGIISFADNVWDIIVSIPWAYMNFGTTDLKTLTLTSAEYDKLEGVLSDDMKSKISPNMRVDQVLLGLQMGSQERADAVGIFQDRDVDHGQHPQTVYTLSPADTVGDFLLSILILVTALCLSGFLIYVSGVILLAGLKILISIVQAPFVALAAIVPEMNIVFTQRWLVRAIDGLSTKIIYGVMTGLLCIIISVVITM